MPRKEHIGGFISQYYWDIADPNFRMPPDTYRESPDGKYKYSNKVLASVLLSTFIADFQRVQYMRFFNFGYEIRDAHERIFAGLPIVGEDILDLIVACPVAGSEFQIVTNEWEHFACLRYQQEHGSQPGENPLQSAWLSVFGDIHRRGIYQRVEPPEGQVIDVTDKFPQIAEACLSVANLLVMNEVDMMRPLEE